TSRSCFRLLLFGASKISISQKQVAKNLSNPEEVGLIAPASPRGAFLDRVSRRRSQVKNGKRTLPVLWIALVLLIGALSAGIPVNDVTNAQSGPGTPSSVIVDSASATGADKVSTDLLDLARD